MTTTAESFQKTVHFIVNKKGGVGKSFTTYLFALRHEKDEQACFFDTDTTRKATMNQCAFLGDRLESVDFLSKGTYDNTKFNTLLYSISKSPYQHFFVDCGGQESLQLLLLFQDYLEVYEDLEDIEIKFVVPISGLGDSYLGSQEFVKELASKTNQAFETTLLIHEGLFNSPDATETQNKITHIEALAKGIAGCSVKIIPGINPLKTTDREILDGAMKGKTLNEFDMFSRSKLKRIINVLP